MERERLAGYVAENKIGRRHNYATNTQLHSYRPFKISRPKGSGAEGTDAGEEAFKLAGTLIIEDEINETFHHYFYPHIVATGSV